MRGTGRGLGAFVLLKPAGQFGDLFLLLLDRLLVVVEHLAVAAVGELDPRGRPSSCRARSSTPGSRPPRTVPGISTTV